MAVHQRTEHYDAMVVGGGLADVCAAITSARHGAKTVIVQNRPMFSPKCRGRTHPVDHGMRCDDHHRICDT